MKSLPRFLLAAFLLLTPGWAAARAGEPPSIRFNVSRGVRPININEFQVLAGER